MERINQRVALTRRMVTEAMLRLAAKKEPDQITVAELCREAGINRATFYRHYQIPRDVLAQLQKEMFYELRDSMTMPSRPEEIYPTLLQLCTYMRDHADTLQILIRSNSDTDFVMFVNEVYTDCWKSFASIPMLRKLDQEDIRFLILYSAGGSYFVLRHWMLDNIQKSPQQMADYLCGLLRKPDWTMLTSQIGSVR